VLRRRVGTGEISGQGSEGIAELEPADVRRFYRQLNRERFGPGISAKERRKLELFLEDFEECSPMRLIILPQIPNAIYQYSNRHQ
jgi:hypothetical protein